MTFLPSAPPSSAPLTCLALAGLLLLGLSSAQAQTPETVASAPAAASAPASPDWRALSAAQRRILAPLEPEWNALDPTRRGKWLEMAARYPQMPPEEQARLQRRMSVWARLSPEERQQARLGFQAARELKADERQAKWEAYQALPEEKRQRLLDKASQKQRPPVAAGGGSKPEQAVQKPNLVPLRSKSELPFGSTVMQAKPGVTTVLINQQGRSQARQPAGSPRLALDLQRLDAKTLLPRPAAPAQQ